MSVDPRRVVVATVLENREPFLLDVVTLFRSLRRFGGGLSNARGFAYFVDSANPSTVDALCGLGVAVEIVGRVSGNVLHANKLAMLRPYEDADYLVALDTDVVVLRDFLSELNGTAVAARPVFVERLTLEEWRRLFDFFGIEFPTARYRMISTLGETVSLNSGVLVVPATLIAPLRNAWEAWIPRVHEAHDVVPKLVGYRHSDQFAFSLALAHARIPSRELPAGMNYPASGHVHPTLRNSRSPYLLHHHHKLAADTGLRRSPFPALNRTIERFNRALFPPPGIVGDGRR